MTAVGSVGTSNAQFLLQQIQQQGRPGLAQGPPQAFQQTVQTAAENLGIDSSQLADIRGDLESALAGVQNSDDPRAAFQDALSGVLEDNGIDAETFKNELRSLFKSNGFGGFGGGGFASGFASPIQQDESIQSLLDILGSSDESDSGALDANSALEYLKSLAPGSLIDQSA